VSENKVQEKKVVEYSRQEVEKFFEIERMDSRSALLFEADVDEAYRQIGVQGDVLDDIQYKSAVRMLSDLGYRERHPVGRLASADQMRYSVDMNSNNSNPAPADQVTPPSKKANGMYIDARKVSEKFGFKLTTVRKWLTCRKSEANPDGLQAYKRGGRIYTTEQDVHDYVRRRSDNA